ncbi:uncharacterized protein ALTATR162_LOCUS4346 [Alternaria atra]|uniref:Uncharacterized protein n=1 Tax=Alternaria atra TaxID=119953 RepID=A0A8J2N0U5_9PLEO|nr:uncharacterized protein ALTATR162_LOCUS4346 [Alternaria atra]CAG5156549.1 unnamed protein product [Alternaria atra]
MLLKSNPLIAMGMAITLQALSASSYSIPSRQQQDLYNSNIVFEAPNPTWLEGIAVRHNGQILTTTISAPILLQIDPSQKRDSIAVARIPDATSTLGITELEKDVFYVSAGDMSNVTATSLVFPSKIWQVDMRHFRANEQGNVTRPAKISLVADLSNTTFVNTLSRLGPKDNSAILISDSGAGHVLRLDVRTGVASVVINDPTMLPNVPGSAGVSGIHIHGSELFYANFAAATFLKMPISLITGKPVGPATLITNGTLIDDFTLSRDGKKAWACTNPRNQLIEIDIPGQSFRTVAEGLNATSAALGRGRFDRDSVYFVSGGGLDFPLTNPGVSGGRVVKVDV